MICPNCNKGTSRVIDTAKAGDTVLRKRRCNNCNQVFYTRETSVTGPLMIEFCKSAFTLKRRYPNNYIELLFKKFNRPY